MQTVEKAGRAVLRLSYASAVITVVVVATMAGFYENQSREVFRHSERAKVANSLSLLRLDLQDTIEANVQLVHGLVAVLEYEPDIDETHFARIAANLIRGQDQVRVVAAAPGLVVSLIHPLEGNEAVLGFDYRSVPERLRAAEMARDLGSTILAGPVDLVQGGRGFIAQTPVVLDPGGGGTPSFWGIVSVVIDQDALYRAGGLLDPDLPISVALSGRDGVVADREVFWGDAAIMQENPVVAEVALPYGTWKLGAIPKGGWSAPPAAWRLRLLFALAALLIVAPMLGTAKLIQSRQAKLAVIKDREAELARLSWRLEFALAASQVGVWDVDLATDELFWDERAKALFGVPDRQGTFCEADWSGVLHPDDRARAMATAEAAVTSDGKFVLEYRIVRPDGAVRHVRDMAAVYQGKNGTKRLAGLVWDVTADVERQEELNLRRLEAEAATVAKSQFLAAMSHEIRTPLGGVLGMLGLILAEPLSKTQRERGEIAQASAEGLLQILNDILDFSKLEANRIRVSAEHVRVRRVVQEVVDLMAAGAEQRGLSLVHDVTDKVPEWIVSDALRLRQVLINLVSNATKFTEAGEVRVSVDYAPSASGGDLLVEVQDTGIGMSPDQCGQIFHHFVQADTSLTRQAGGTGLGLAISRQLVELMGGVISVRSVAGMGSTFGFSIQAPAGTPVLGPAAKAAKALQGAARNVPPMRILLAEDNATNRYLINAYLLAAGQAVTTVENGAQAVSAVQTGAFDVALMDVQMPLMDGVSAARAIRALSGSASTIPIIALTANAMAGDRELCIAAGMTDYLSKPIEVSAFYDALLRAHAASGSAAAAMDDAHLAPRRSMSGG